MELERRYNILRAEEHARTDGRCGSEWSRKAGLDPHNKDRNRYTNIIPWDHSRVKLPVKTGGNDYINASWVQLGAHTYIASQGPLASTAAHFWQMVYAYGGDPATIVMLTPVYEHVVEKCARYWPSDKASDVVYPREQGDFEFGLAVRMEKKSENEHYTYSQFKLVPDDPAHPAHIVHHLYYNTWLDYSKPNADADIRALIQLVNNSLKNPGAPLVVHCSAGIGRTGTFIAIDALLSKIDCDIRLPQFPLVSPVWKEDVIQITDKATPFSGMSDEHDVSSSPLGPTNLNPLSTIAKRSSSFSSETEEEPDSRRGSQSRRRKPSMFDSVRPSDVPLGVLEESSTGENTPVPEGADEPKFKPQTLHNPSDREDSEVFFNPLVFDAKEVSPVPPINVSSLTSALKSSKGKTETTNTSPASNGTASTNGSVSGDSASTTSTVATSVGSTTLGGSAKTGPALSGSAKSGPVLLNRPSQIQLPENLLEERPDTIDVVDWFDHVDPVMSAVRCMRKQRPKMVQGKQQLGYIYDQLEIAQQLARAHSISRRDTFAGHELSSSGMSIRSGDSTVVASLNRSDTSLHRTKSKASASSVSGRKLFRRSALTTMFSHSPSSKRSSG